MLNSMKNLTMKIKLTTILAVVALTTFTQADELPKAAKEILEKLSEYEEHTLSTFGDCGFSITVAQITKK